MRTIPELVQAVEYPNVQAFTHVLRNGESSQEDSAFNLLYGGDSFDSFDDHPRKHFPLPDGQTTSAAGAYQETESSWNDFTAHTGQLPFTPENQTLCAVWLIDRAGALEDVIAGRLDAAIRKLTKVWTSLAIQKRQAQAPAIFKEYGGSLADAPDPPQAQPESPVLQAVVQPQKVKTVGLLAALLPTIFQLLPQLIPVLSGGHNSDEAKMWQGAGMVVANTLQTATNTDNIVQAVAAMQKDPAVLAAASAAIDELIPQLTEAGSGGIDGARKSAVALADTPLTRNTPFLVTCMFYPLIVIVVLSAVLDLPWLAKLSSDTRSTVIGFVMGVIAGSIISFFFGTTKDSSHKTDLLAAK